MKKGKIIVVSAPSGCGKGTILREILKDKIYHYSISATTRKPRSEDTDGVTYHFLTREEFEEKIKNGELVEYTEYCENYYGTLKSEIYPFIESGKNVILEIEVNGAMNIRKIFPDAILLFIVPPSIDELRHRLKKRGTETDEVIEERVKTAEKELEYIKDYDYKIVNAALEDAIDDFKSIIRAEQCKIEK